MNTSIEALSLQQLRYEKGAERVYRTATAGTGLSHCHNSPQVTFYPGGTLVETVIPQQVKSRNKGRRRAVAGFSAKSRRRLQFKIAKVDREHLPYFVTLTYPSEFPTARQTKKHLDAFGKAIKRRGYGAIWKLEPQQRGAPHYHLLMWGPLKSIKAIRAWVAETWFRIVDSGDEKHLRAGTQVQRVRSMKGVRSYAAKYMGKEVKMEGWESPGRFWGVLGGQNIPWSESVTVELPEWMIHRLKRWMRKYTGWGYVSHKGQTFFVNNPDDWLDRLPEMCIDSL